MEPPLAAAAAAKATAVATFGLENNCVPLDWIENIYIETAIEILSKCKRAIWSHQKAARESLPPRE